ncbi:TSC22 domain containing protein [Euroglyphus maynei]|uniref:TSC22 domain containing protein n=1 Tax=Euroglyphus maynei TaxID=6958 RepID=A0A1Y3BC18_EURMA|nr:TSC22 domain containing protein [Euroglyphus maynei]
MRHRFKVVKLVSSQPYTRGRWTCFDYNDENQNTINISKHVPANKIAPNEQLEQSVLLQDQNCQTGNVSGGQINSDQSEVAIDNKIEQAMDLVKSHLMFAVREEVDNELRNWNQTYRY